MDVLQERCAGLDVHKLTVVACVVTPGPRGRPHKEVRTFGTTSEALLQLADWLRERGVPAAGGTVGETPARRRGGGRRGAAPGPG